MSQHRPDPTSDHAFDRLRAADPAAGAEPDLRALDAAVRLRLDGGDELARARGARRDLRWATVAAVTAGTLVVGLAGGYALGAGRPVPVGAASAQAPISLPAAGGAEALTDASARTGAAGAAVEGDSVASTTMPWFGGRTVFSASGLSDAPGTARAWAFDPAPTFTAETAGRMAASLGLAGEARMEGGAWVVGPQDGSSAALQLQPDGVTSVSYYDPARDPFACASAVPEPSTLGGGATGTEGTDDAGGLAAPDVDRLAVPPCPTPAASAPRSDAAVQRAREVLAAAGADADAYEYEVTDAGMPSATYVTAFGVLDGQRTGLTWNLTLVGDGVQSLYGALAPLVPLGDYDVVSENEAVTRLSDPRFGSSGGFLPAVGVAADVARPGTAAGAASAETAPVPDAPALPAAVAPGAPLGWPVTEVVLTGARLGLAQHTVPGGATVLLPAYELSADDGSVWSVVAVADEDLDFSAGR